MTEQLPVGWLSAGAFVAAAKRRTASRGTDGGELVAELAEFVRRYVVMSPSQLHVVALWVIHTHCVELFPQTPYLAVTSPERQCGKSRLLDVLDLVVARPWLAVLPSEAVVFRTLSKSMPTLLLDETDTIFNPKSADKYEGLRALLNSGHRRGARVPRCVGATGAIQEFDVYSAKVLAGIGTLPDTVADRSVPIRLERRRDTEAVERFRRRDAEPPAEALLEKVSVWLSEHVEALADARPPMPDELSDRMQEGCECLVAIADAAGCGAEARSALVELLTAERLDDQESMRLRLLRDIRAIFEKRQMPNAIATAELLVALAGIEEAPWRTYYARGLDARDLATLLHHYGISSTTIRTGKVRTGEQRKPVAKGYKRDDFYEAWTRYL